MEAGYRGAKGFERRSQDGGSNGTIWGDITKESEEMQIEALKEAYEELRKRMAKRHFRSDPRRRDNAPSAL